MTPLTHKIVNQAWFLDEAAWFTLLTASQHEVAIPDKLNRRPEYDYYGEPMPQMEMHGEVAVVPVHGPLIKKASAFEKWLYSASSYEDIEEDIDSAIGAGAKKIMLAVDSPGGTVNGCEELGGKIAGLIESGVQFYSFSDTIQASAAEYITAPITDRMATPTAELGCIGTVLTSVNYGQMLSRAGIEVNVIASGPLKATGNPLVKMSDRQREYLQGVVDKLGNDFKNWMSGHRPSLTSEHMQGQTFSGRDAEKIGLIDAVVGGFLEAIGHAAS